MIIFRAADGVAWRKGSLDSREDIGSTGGEEVDEEGGKAGLPANPSHDGVELYLQEDVVVGDRELPREGRPYCRLEGHLGLLSEQGVGDRAVDG